VTFTRSGRRTATTTASLLEQAEELGLRPESGCRMGICFSCTATKTSGTVRNVLTGEESSAPGEDIRICVSRAIGDCHIEI
jgi:ferredoxin